MMSRTDTRKDYDFGGRIRPKAEKSQHSDLVRLPHQRMAFIYQRLSTTEQKKNSLYSVERQDSLYELAAKDGYQVQMTAEEIEAIKKDKKYPGHFVDGQVWVEQRDLGISGTLDHEHRPGLAQLVEIIEQDLVESVYVVEISRISRDQTLITGLAFGELCKAHNVVIVTPMMRFNLNNDMHMRIYRYEIDRAAEELKSITFRLHGARDLKAQHGYYSGGSIPPGFILDLDDRMDGHRNPNYQKYKVWEPHAEVVRLIFQQLRLPGETPKSVAVHLRENDIAFPPFPADVATVSANVSSFSKSKKNPDGSYPIGRTRIESIARNPAYIGWWLFGGKLISRYNHPPIIDEEAFWEVQEKFSKGHSKPRGDPLPLAGLLRCLKHSPPRSLIHANSATPRYHCRDHVYEDNCFTLTSRILDDPVSDVVLSKCCFPGYTERVIEQLEGEYQQAKSKAETYRREVHRLTKEIDNLKENLAYTRSQEQVQMILELIDERMKQREELAKIESYPVGRVITASQVRTVKAFLQDLPKKWAEMPDLLKNELFEILLYGIYLYVAQDTVRTFVVWRTGFIQEILIHRPFVDKRRRWTKEEKAILREHYADATPQEMEAMLPGREWQGIRKTAEALGLNRSEDAWKQQLTGSQSRSYSPEEDQVIHDYFAFNITRGELFERLSHRSWDSINFRVRKLGYSFRERQQKVRWELVNESVITGEFDEDALLEIINSASRLPEVGAKPRGCACRIRVVRPGRARHDDPG